MPPEDLTYELNRIDSLDLNGTVYAAADHTAKAVWGIGNTPGHALADARYWMRHKPGFQVTALDVVPMEPRPKEDYDADGETLYRLCVSRPPESSPVQGTLI